MKDFSAGCSASPGSLTQAMKLQKALAAAAIPSKIIKSEQPHGCSYAVTFSCSQLANVQSVLAHEKIKVKQWNGI